MINLLNAGYIHLIDHMGDDSSIVNAARYSYKGDEGYNPDPIKDGKLIEYLWKNSHTSPFEHVFFTFKVKCPMFIGEQWLRHRTWKFNKVSGRYTELPNEMYLPELDQITTQHSSNKQMRTNERNKDANWIQSVIGEQNAEAYDTYEFLIRRGCPRELARGVLPANVYTQFVASVDLHNLLHFIKLRIHPHAQYEIRIYAEAILELITPIVPVSVAAFKRFRMNESSLDNK